MKDNINPSHYQQYGCQTIEVTRRLGFTLGNVFKYISRAPFKGAEEEDLQKALWYLKDYKKFVAPKLHFVVPIGYPENYRQLEPTLLKYLKPIKDKKLYALLLKVAQLEFYLVDGGHDSVETSLIEYSSGRGA